MRPFISRNSKSYSNYAGFIKIADGIVPDTSCSVHEINNMFEHAISYPILKQINEMCSPMNNAVVLFTMLLACAPIHQILDYDVAPACTTIGGSKEWSLNLLQMGPGVHYVQVNQHVILGASFLHVIVFHVLKQYSCIFSKE